MKNTELSVNISSDELPLAALHKVAAATRAHTYTHIHTAWQWGG